MDPGSRGACDQLNQAGDQSPVIFFFWPETKRQNRNRLVNYIQLLNSVCIYIYIYIYL